VNPKIDEELKEFKAEIKQKFGQSEIQRTYVFPRVASAQVE
jgi:hypothetical protein